MAGVTWVQVAPATSSPTDGGDSGILNAVASAWPRTDVAR